MMLSFSVTTAPVTPGPVLPLTVLWFSVTEARRHAEPPSVLFRMRLWFSVTSTVDLGPLTRA